MRSRLSVLAAAMLVAAPVHAHVGAAVSRVVFTSPPAPTTHPADGGLSVDPYTFAQADASYDVHWTTAPADDPTARLTFYYLDYQPPSALTYDQIISIATAIPEASGDNGIWVSCTCDSDGGVICPDAGSRAGKCAITQFTWNTVAIPAGAYWLIALNKDPPYQVYNVSGGPIRVAHGGAALPPASVVLLPDGLFAADRTYRTQWISTGQPPFRFDVFYGIDDTAHALDPPKTLGTNITPIQDGDGAYRFDWDVSSYAAGLYDFGVEVSDATGQKSATRSYFGLNVYHPPDSGAPSFDAEAGQDAPPIDAASPAADVASPALDAGIDLGDAAGSADGDGGALAPNDAMAERDVVAFTDGATQMGGSGSNADESGGCGCRTSGPVRDARGMMALVVAIALGARRRATRVQRRLKWRPLFGTRSQCSLRRTDFAEASTVAARPDRATSEPPCRAQVPRTCRTRTAS
jgi:MYXO-CTERM domain-containing protein